MLLIIGVYLYKVLICRLLILCCGENILWRFTLGVYYMDFLKQEMLTTTESFVKYLFIAVEFSIFILFVILTDLRWKNILSLIDLIDWLIDWLCSTPILSNISAISSRSTRREPSIMDNQLVNFITCGCKSSAPFCILHSLARNHAVLVIALYEVLCNPTT